MKKPLRIPLGLLLIIILVSVYSSYKNRKNQVKNTETSETINFISKKFSDNDFKSKSGKELTTQDFETAYKLGETFLNDYYLQKSGVSKIDFSKYIVNENLLKYSNKRGLVENKGLDIKKVSIRLDKAQFIHEENCYYFIYTIITQNSYNGGFSEPVEILISNVNGKLVISDWYIRYGAGSSSFDEKFRFNATINSPKIWDNREFIKALFEKAGIE